MNPQVRQKLRKQVRFFYDVQRARLQTGGHVLGQSDKGPIQLLPEDLEELKKRHDTLHLLEKNLLADVEKTLQTIPFYANVLSDKRRYKGVGPTMAGVILSEFDIYKAEKPSQFWSFAGLAPTDCARCKACHAIVVKQDGEVALYKHPKNIKGVKCKLADTEIEHHQVYQSSKTMKPTKNQKLPYNSFLRMKMISVLGPVLLRLGSPWTKCFYDRRAYRQSTQWGISDGHRKNDAIRYMIKMLLLDIWKEWRLSEGLPVRPSWAEEKLGHVHTPTPMPGMEPMDGEELGFDVAAEVENAQRG